MDETSVRGFFGKFVSAIASLAMAFSLSTVASAASSSPFMGQWQTTALNGSSMTLSIAGRPAGPWQITWTDHQIVFCGGQAGILRGTAWPAQADPNSLTADVQLSCIGNGQTLDLQLTGRLLTSNVLTLKYYFGTVTTWHRPSVPPWSSLVQAAQQEGGLTVIALPSNWCNYGQIINGFEAAYGIPVNSVAPSASSGQELQAIRDSVANPTADTPDVIDVGPSYAIEAQSEGLITSYKVSEWDTIPADMKDANGYWYGDYYGIMSIATNGNLSASPSSWDDVRNRQDVAPFALGGDPTSSNIGFFAVYSAALANGGSLDNIAPGVQYFGELNSLGRLLPSTGSEGTLVSGETPVLAEWSYLALAQRDAYPAANIQVSNPQPGRIASFYVQAVSTYAAHPNAARLWMEYLYSDTGQLGFLNGYCFPARFDDLQARNVIPADLLARLPDPTGAAFPSVDQILAAQAYVDTNWACTVYASGCP